MKKLPPLVKIFFAALLAVSIASCEKDYYYETPPPHTPKQTNTLEANHVTAAPSAINASYWKTADYFK
jgi:hypothetical protein